MNFDITLARLRERIAEPRSDYGLGECELCGGLLTQADLDGGCCTQCGNDIFESDNDGSKDEDLWEQEND